MQTVTGKTAGEVLAGAMRHKATRIKRLVRPGGSGAWRIDYDVQPGAPVVGLRHG
jgi:hypothetical protein